jgi:hypothetical protein
MSLVPYTITALERDVADADASGKNIISGATCSMFIQPANTAALLYDDAAGSNGSTAKVTNASGQVVVFVEAGTYIVSVNGVAGVRVDVDQLRADLAGGTVDVNLNSDLTQTYTFKTVALMKASTIVFPVGKKIMWQGYYVESDGGSNWGIVTIGTHTDDGGSEFTLADGKYIAANLKGKRIGVRKFGAYGNFGTGSNDDTTAIRACLSYALTNETSVKFSAGKYVVSNTLTVEIDTVFDGGAFIYPVGMPASAAVYDITARTKHEGVTIIGNAAVDPANGTIGIRIVGTLVGSSRVQIEKCTVFRCNYGILIGTFSVMVTNCLTNSCNTNIGMYAPASNQEINDINIIGGNHSNPAGDYAVDIGVDALTPIAKGLPQGTRILLQGFAMDGGSLRINGVDNITADNLYFEFTTTGKCIEIGQAGFDGGVNVVSIKNCRFKSTDYAVYCFAGVRDLEMKQSNYSAINTCGLYLSTDIYNYNYKKGYLAASFTNGQEVHTGCRGGAFYQFGGRKTIDLYEMVNGASVGSGGTSHIYRNRVNEDATGVSLFYNSQNLLTSYGRQFVAGTGATKTGTVSGSIITFATQADVQVFNGGDSVSVGGTRDQIRFVDYDAKTATMTSGSYPQGSQSIEQQELSPRLSGSGNSTPTRTDGLNGSVIFSENTGQIGWVYQSGAWVSF